MYAALSQAAFSTAGSLYRSDDMAQTWKRIDHGVQAESTVMSVSTHPADPARVYCATRSGQVIGTEDNGASWTDYRLPQGVQDVTRWRVFDATSGADCAGVRSYALSCG